MQQSHRRPLPRPQHVEALVSVREAVQRDLDAIAERDADLASSGLALSALALAARMDDPDTSATATASCAKALLETLGRLHELVPAEQESDRLDELAARRTDRIA